MSAAVEQSRKEASPSCGLWSLPDEIAIDCFARVSRVDHAALSMASKSYRSLVVSPELYETRSRMGCTEECVYVFIDSPIEPNPRWFILSVNKNRNRLIPIPSFPTPRSATLVSLGCGIYVIGGLIDCMETALVSYLDCRTHTWSYLPSMNAARAGARAGVLDGKIYVFGGCVEDPSIWAEVFDPKLQTWTRDVIPEDLMKATELRKVVQGQETVTVSCNFPRVQGLWNDFNYCATDRLLYCMHADGSIMWCDPLSGVRQGAMVWRHVYGLNALKPFLSIYSDPDSSLISFHGDLADVWQCYLLNHGHKDGLLGFMPDNKLLTSSRGNILVFWDVLVGDADPKTLEIWCAEISMQMWEGYMWGNVLWSEAVFSTDPRFGFQIPVQGGLPLRESLTKEVKTKSGQEHEFRFLRMTAGSETICDGADLGFLYNGPEKSFFGCFQSYETACLSDCVNTDFLTGHRWIRIRRRRRDRRISKRHIESMRLRRIREEERKR